MALLALTDHDTTAGVGEAASAAAREGIGLVPAAEISTLADDHQELHLLGYLIDPDDPQLTAALQRSRGDRAERAHAMAEALRELGFTLDEEALARRAARGGSIGRPHLAQAVLGTPENMPRLQREGLGDPATFLEAYLIPGRPAFRPRRAPSVEEAIELVHGAGGVAVWAHPFWDIESPQRVIDGIDRFRRAGLDGVEAFYVTHTESQTRLLAQRCAELGLLSTGSSDYHGPDHRIFSGFRAFHLYGLRPELGPIAG